MILLLLACTSDCDFTDAVNAVVEGDEVDCGDVADDADGTTQWACALDAWNAGTPFQVRWSSGGIDSTTQYALVYDGDRAWFLSQDQYQSGPWEIEARECVDPYAGTWPDDTYDETDVAGYPALLCGSYAPENNSYLVCDVGMVHGPEEPLAWPP